MTDRAFLVTKHVVRSHYPSVSEPDRPPSSGLEHFHAIYDREFDYVWRTLGRMGDQQDHPTGGLAEKRDALIVQALAKLSRSEEARVAAAEFIARYPNTIHRARVERVLEELP